MAGQEQSAPSIFGVYSRIGTWVLFFIMMVATTILSAVTAQAQKFTVLHAFADGMDGASLFSGVAIDRYGTVYGVTYAGGYTGGICAFPYGSAGCGVVFRLVHRGSGWTFTPIYSFTGPPDGAYPAGVVVGADGSLYGTTYGGGSTGQGNCLLGANGCGTVFNLKPPPNPCITVFCPWDETVLYRFSGTNGDGDTPYNGDLVFDGEGSIYGTTEVGGAYGAGVVYQLTPSHGAWAESVLYAFNASGSGWGGEPQSGVIFDHAGNLYGTEIEGGGVYQLTPSQSGWTGKLLQAFNTCMYGCGIEGGLIMDAAGNLYGATTSYGPNGGGTVYELLASQGWNVNLVYSFTGNSNLGGVGPADKLTMDAAGNLYGTTQAEGFGYGTVFKLTPSGGSWTYTDLHSFTGGKDGAFPYGSVAIDGNGNLYGTTEAGGDLSKCQSFAISGCGVVWEITP